MRKLALLVASAAVCVGMHAQSTRPEPHTEAAVIAADDGWSRAEQTGDTAYVDALLLPEYRSIGADGKTHDKSAILANTKLASPERTAKIEKWLAERPTLKAVTLNGDTAVLTFTLNKTDTPKAVMSCDIFVYRDGRWRALYSQHTTAGV